MPSIIKPPFDVKKYYDDLARLFKSGPQPGRQRIAHHIAAPGTPGVPVGTAKAFLRHVSNSYASTLASYGQYNRLARYSDYNEMECLHPTTLVYTVEHGLIPIKDLSEKYTNPKDVFHVYSYDHDQKKIVIDEAFHPRATRLDLTYKVTFDDGGFVIANSTHPFMLRDGSYSQVKDLKCKDALMPFCGDENSFNHLDESRNVSLVEPFGDSWGWVYDLSTKHHHNFAVCGEESWNKKENIKTLRGAVFVHNSMAEINSALDIYSDETCSTNEDGEVVTITSADRRITESLYGLFYETLNIEFEAWNWIRNLPVSHDTPIPLLSGETIPISEVSKKVKLGEDVWVYSVQDKTNALVPGKVTWCDKNYTSDKLVYVELDNGSLIKTAPEHPFLLRDGSLKRADELVENDSLMPFYRRESSKKHSMKGYEMVYDPSAGRKYKYTHRVVSDNITGYRRDSRNSDLVIHHKNFNKKDNHPSNLQVMNNEDHLALHKDHCLAVLHSPEVTKKRLESLQVYLRSDKRRKRLSEEMSGHYPAYFQRYNNSDLRKVHDKTIRSVSCTKQWKNGDLKEKVKLANTLQFDQKCFDFIVEKTEKNRSFLSASKLVKLLLKDEAFMRHFKKINSSFYGKARLPEKTFARYSIINVLVQKVTNKNYYDSIKQALPWVVKDPVYQKYCPKNHKVRSVKVVEETADVYCMTVVSPTGKRDRHNFAVCGLGADGEVVDSGVFVANCKYGDQFLLIDHHPDFGVINALPLPINEIEREEGYDEENPMAYRYRWITQGNKILENWQVVHFRLRGNDNFIPYGSSILEGARRVWRQLILMEDAVMVYRIVRSPERRVFYIDVGNIAPGDVSAFMQKAQTQLKRNQIVDSSTGRVDLRYNPMCNSLKTLLFLQDGRTLSLKDLIAEWESGKQDQWVYSIDRESNKLVPGKVSWAGVTRRDAQLVRVHLDNKTFLDVTPDHKMMLRDKSYIEAKDLKPGTALMPLYKKWTSKDDGHKIVGYEKIYDPFLQSYVLTHRNNVIVTKGFDEIKGKVVHHADFNKLNNNPDNLEAMTWKEHCVLHGASILKYNKSEIGRENSRKNLKRMWETEKIKPDTFVKLWKNDEVRKKRVDRLSLKIDENFIEHCFRILDLYGTGLSTTESYFRGKLNKDEEFVQYLQKLNTSFKNGFSDKLTRGQLQKILKSVGFRNAFTDLKRTWLFKRTNIDEIIKFCENNERNVTRKDVLRKFALSRRDLEEVVTVSGHQYLDFSNTYFLASARYKKKEYKNHKVVKLEWLSVREDTGCITVNKYHNFAIAGHEDCYKGSLKGDNYTTGIFVKNSTDEDYFIPIRGEHSSRIDTLPGGQFTGDIDDLKYIQNKLFAALKIPKSYLGYEEDISGKSTLSQEDVRFSSTIRRIQKVFIQELKKIAVIHLWSMGFRMEELTNFDITMANPSSIAELQKLELLRAKFEVSSMVGDNMLDRHSVYRKIWKLEDEEISRIEQGKRKDKMFDLEIENMQLNPPVPEGGLPPADPNAPGLPPPPATTGEGRDPNKQVGAPNELTKVVKPKEEPLFPDLHAHVYNTKKTAMDPKRGHSEWTRTAKAPFGEDVDPEEFEEKHFKQNAAKLKKLAEDLENSDVLRIARDKKTKKVLSD